MSGSQPTRVRYWVVFAAFVMSLILYLDRFCVSFAERYIKEDLSLTEAQMATFISAFFLSYALAQVPFGWLGDRFGARGILTFYILAWSAFTALIGVAHGFVFLLLMRLGCGASQAGAYPVSAGLLKKWMPFTARGSASAMVVLGGRAGGAIAPILTAYLIVLFVPINTPTTFDASQVLNVDRFLTRLAPRPKGDGDATIDFESKQPEAVTWASPVARRVWEFFSPELRRQIVSPPDADESASRLALVDDVLNALNSHLPDRDFYRKGEFDQLNVAGEVLKVITRLDKGEPVSDPEAARTTRLLLEAGFPNELRKLYTKGWRPVLVLYGVAGIAAAVLFWIVYRNHPREHSACNDSERLLIAGGDESASVNSAQKAAALPFRYLLTSRSLWLSSINQFTTNAGWLFFVTYLARYLLEVHSVPIIERGWMAMIPPLGGIAGMVCGGHVTDWLVHKVGLRWSRALPMAFTRFAAAASYLVCLWIDSPWMATLAFAAGFFFVDFGIAATWAFKQDVGGKYVGSILGWGNMWGNLGATGAPYLYNYVLGATPTKTDWNNMFVVCAGLFVLAGVAAIFIDSTKPIVPESVEG